MPITVVVMVADNSVGIPKIRCDSENSTVHGGGEELPGLDRRFGEELDGGSDDRDQDAEGRHHGQQGGEEKQRLDHAFAIVGRARRREIPAPGALRSVLTSRMLLRG